MKASVGAARSPLVRGAVALLGGLAEAAGSVDRREWATALAVGFVFGLTEALRVVVNFGGAGEAWRLDLALRLAALYIAGLSLACALLAAGLRWLDRRGDDGPSFAGQAALVGSVAVLVAAVGGQPMREAHTAWLVALDNDPSTWKMGAYSAAVTHLAFVIAMYLSLWTLVYRFLQRSRRGAEQLAAAQARGIDAERRVLAEQLAGAQAMVEPAFLFDTLQLADRLFDRDTALAQKIFDELHRYLRAALPPADGSLCTLGQQTELLRARLAIEAIRLDGRLAARIDVRSELAAHPLAPMLLLPLAANAVRHGIEPSGGGEIVVHASEGRGRLRIEVADDGAGRAADIREAAGLSALRERLAALYGGQASLVFVDREPRGVAARIEIDHGVAA